MPVSVAYVAAALDHHQWLRQYGVLFEG